MITMTCVAYSVILLSSPVRPVHQYLVVGCTFFSFYCDMLRLLPSPRCVDTYDVGPQVSSFAVVTSDTIIIGSVYLRPRAG